MKKILSISLAILVLFSSTGITLATHLCGGNAVDLQVMYGMADVGCGMEEKITDPCTDDQQVPHIKMKGCCDNIMASIDIDEYHVQLLKSVDLTFIVAFAANYLGQYSFKAEKHTTYLSYSPPLLEQDIQILHQSFLL